LDVICRIEDAVRERLRPWIERRFEWREERHPQTVSVHPSLDLGSGLQSDALPAPAHFGEIIVLAQILHVLGRDRVNQLLVGLAPLAAGDPGRRVDRVELVEAPALPESDDPRFPVEYALDLVIDPGMRVGACDARVGRRGQNGQTGPEASVARHGRPRCTVSNVLLTAIFTGLSAILTRSVELAEIRLRTQGAGGIDVIV